MKAVRVMLADSSEDVLAQLQKILDGDPRVQVVGTARQGAECIRKATVAKPHVLIMDLKFPDMGGGRVIRQLATLGLPMAVIICSPFAVKGSPVLQAALSAGAFDFILSPTDPRRLDRIGRQVLTAIFVAAFSKTKQIPIKGEAEPKQVEAAIAQLSQLDAFLIDCGSDRIKDVRLLVTRLKPKFRPAVMLILRTPPPFAADFVSDLEREVKIPIHEGKEGEYILSGHVYALNQTADDRVIERNVSGEWVAIKSFSRGSDKPSSEPGPNATLLYDSFGRTYGAKCAVALVGHQGPSAIEGLTGLKRFQTLTVVDERSKALIDQLKAAAPESGVPDDILSLEQIESIISGRSGSAK